MSQIGYLRLSPLACKAHTTEYVNTIFHVQSLGQYPYSTPVQYSRECSNAGQLVLGTKVASFLHFFQ